MGIFNKWRRNRLERKLFGLDTQLARVIAEYNALAGQRGFFVKRKKKTLRHIAFNISADIQRLEIQLGYKEDIDDNDIDLSM